MSLTTFLHRAKNSESIEFDEVIAIITEHYHYEPTEFSSGLADKKLVNAAGTNEGSCKIFAFAQLNKLNQEQTLNLFGDYYYNEVLRAPTETGHQNIKNFILDGWHGIDFSQPALTLK